jgi:hypothetical protein
MKNWLHRPVGSEMEPTVYSNEFELQKLSKIATGWAGTKINIGR